MIDINLEVIFKKAMLQSPKMMMVWYKEDDDDDDIYIMMQCGCVTKNDHFLKGLSVYL